MSRTQLAATLKHLRCGGDVVRLLAGQDVRVVLLKGAALIDDVYRADERTLGDFDLLVRPRDFERAHEVLVEHGYKMHEAPRRPATTMSFHQRAYFNQAGCNIDLHRHLDEPGRWKVDDDALFARAVPLTFEGVTTARLSDIDQLLHLAIHLTKEEYGSQTRSVQDMARLIASRPPDWQELVRRAARWRCKTTAWVALGLVHDVHGGDVPRGVLHELAPGTLHRGYLRLWLARDQEPSFRRPHWRRRRQLVLRAALLDTWAQRWQDVAGVLHQHLGDLCHHA